MLRFFRHIYRSFLRRQESRFILIALNANLDSLLSRGDDLDILLGGKKNAEIF